MLTALGYLGLSAPDLARWSRFAETVLGAQAVPEEDVVRLRVDDRAWRIEVSEGEQGLRFVGWEVSDPDTLERVVRSLEEAELKVHRDPELAEVRGVRDLVRATDPVGTPLEFFHGATVAPTRFASPTGAAFVTGPLGLGHVVLGTDRPAELQRFYRERLGFKLTDTFRATHFMRVNPRHHSLAVGNLPGATCELRHFMVELADLDAVGRALDAALEAEGWAVTRTLGRHTNDQMISFYVAAPCGVTVEIGCGGLLVDDTSWTTPSYTTATAWGHRSVGTAGGSAA